MATGCEDDGLFHIEMVDKKTSRLMTPGQYTMMIYKAAKLVRNSIAKFAGEKETDTVAVSST